MPNTNDDTENFLISAGICQGMRVLDIGCGSGILSAVLARIVGSKGAIVGLDYDQNSLIDAQARIDELNYSPIVSFRHHDLTKDLPDELGFFDACICRRVLMYLPDPTTTLRNVSRFLHPGGIFAIQEVDLSIRVMSSHPMPLHDQVRDWIFRTVSSEGANTHIGVELPTIVSNAGLLLNSIRAQASIQGQSNCAPLSFIAKVMTPRIISKGIATAEEINIETLTERLEAERVPNCVYITDMAFFVVARKL